MLDQDGDEKLRAEQPVVQAKDGKRWIRDPKLSVGDAVFVYFPAKKSGKAYKFARPFQGP